MKVKAVITGFTCGKVQKNGNPIIHMTISTALLKQVDIDRIGREMLPLGLADLPGLSNYVNVEFHEINPKKRDGGLHEPT